MNLDFGEVLIRAWQIVKKHRILWFYGFLQTMAGFLLVLLAVVPAFTALISDQSPRIINEPWFFLIFILGFFVFLLAVYPLSVVMNGALSLGVLRADRRGAGEIELRLRVAAQARISTRVPLGTSLQIRSISSFVTATQPSVQSTFACDAPTQPKPLRSPWIMMSPPRFVEAWDCRCLLDHLAPAMEVVGPLLEDEASVAHAQWMHFHPDGQ